MAMNFLEDIKGQSVGNVLTNLASEGGTTAVGFLGSSFVGGQVEKLLLAKDAAGNYVPVTDMSPTLDKVKAWFGNNVPKVAAYYMLRGRADAPGTVYDDLKKSIAGSVVYDTLVRASNQGVAPLYPTIFGLGEDKDIGTLSKNEIQKMIQENGSLRQQLVATTRKLAEDAGQPQVNTAETPEQREREFAFMQPPAQRARERQFGFSGEEPGIAAMFGML